MITSQEAQLAAWIVNMKGQEEVLRKEIAGLQESIQGSKAQVESNKARGVLFKEELEGEGIAESKRLKIQKGQ